MSWYLLKRPDGVVEVLDSWLECQERLKVFPSAPHQAVDSREKAEAMANGGIRLPAGEYLFTDGNALGGVGITHLQSNGEHVRVLAERPTDVFVVFGEGSVNGLESRAAIATALDQIHNILAELAGLYGGIHLLPERSRATVVHDYRGVGDWMTGAYKKTNHPVTKAVVAACQAAVEDRGLKLSYVHQRGHQKARVARDDFATWNNYVDELADTVGKGEAQDG